MSCLNVFNKTTLLKLAVIAALSSSASIAAAADDTNTTSNNSNWQFHVIPYVWAINMNGDVQVASEKVHVSESFNDLWHKMNFGGMIWLDAYYKERFSLFLNTLYARLTDNVTEGPVTVDTTANFALVTGGASYKAYMYDFSNGKSRFEIEPYVGARFTQNNVSLDILNLSFSDNQNWTDPIAGVRFNYFLNENWLANLAGDVGGTNMSTDTSYNITALVGYHPTCGSFWKRTTMYVGYRYLQQHYETGGGINKFNWQMKLYGPMAGISISL